MIRPVHNLLFSSHINVVNDRKQFDDLGYSKLCEEGLSANSPWGSRERVSLKTKGVSVKAYDCTAGGFQNGKRMTLFHLASYLELWFDKTQHNYEDWADAEKALEEDIEALKAENPDVRGFLTGGKADDPLSCKLKEHLASLFEKHQIPFSTVWGSLGEEDVHYDVETDTWTVYSELMDYLKSEEPERIFPQIHIDPGDALFVNGKKVNTEA